VRLPLRVGEPLQLLVPLGELAVSARARPPRRPVGRVQVDDVLEGRDQDVEELLAPGGEAELAVEEDDRRRLGRPRGGVRVRVRLRLAGEDAAEAGDELVGVAPLGEEAVGARLEARGGR